MSLHVETSSDNSDYNSQCSRASTLRRNRVVVKFRVCGLSTAPLLSQQRIVIWSS